MEVDKPDISSYLIQDAKRNGFTTADRKFLNGDAVTIVIAGRFAIHKAHLHYLILTQKVILRPQH